MDPTTTTSDDRFEFCLFDLETTFPGQQILEFGAILVCPKRLVTLGSYSSLVRPDDLSSLPPDFVRRNGISRDVVAVSPSFFEIADKVHDFLHGRVWVGHNIEKFDCMIIREAFEKIGRPAPEPKRIIDTLALLTQKFGRRAGDMKMATLASYFGIGPQTHRSLDDTRMNLEVLKHCAAVLLLESSLPNGYTGFLELDEVSITSISACLIPYYHGTNRIKLLHKDVALQLFCPRLRVRFGLHAKYFDQAGMPRLSFVVDASPRLCEVLKTCDAAAKKISEDSGSKSKWRPVVVWDYHNTNNSTARLRIPTLGNGDTAQYATEIHQNDWSGVVQKLEFSKFDAEELGNLFRTGISVDAFFSLYTYDYQECAGIRLVAKKLVICSD